MERAKIKGLFITDFDDRARLLAGTAQLFEEVQIEIRTLQHSEFIEQVCNGKLRSDVVLIDVPADPMQLRTELPELASRNGNIPVILLLTEPERDAVAHFSGVEPHDYLFWEHLSPMLLERAVIHALERAATAEHVNLQHAQLRAITTQLPAIVWTLDRNLRFTSSFGSGLASLDLKPGEVVGMTIFDYFQTRDLRNPIIQGHMRALAGEFVSMDVDWQSHIFHTHLQPLYSDDPERSEIIGVIGVALDITESRRIEEELHVAHRIQQQLLPHTYPQIPGLDIAGGSFPAVDVGGDLFDFIPLSNGGVRIIVGDVTGHGVGAALLMGCTISYLRAASTMALSPCETLQRVNELVYRDLGDDRFVTVFVGDIDPTEKTLTYCSAGHNNAYVLDGDGNLLHILPSTDLPLGIEPDCQFSNAGPIALHANDLFFVATDGLTESAAPDGSYFTDDRGVAIVRLFHEDSAQQIVSNVYHAARAFSQGTTQKDDICLAVVKILPDRVHD